MVREPHERLRQLVLSRDGRRCLVWRYQGSPGRSLHQLGRWGAYDL
jgi:hypothetical protein